jgi:hypothetical protein
VREEELWCHVSKMSRCQVALQFVGSLPVLRYRLEVSTQSDIGRLGLHITDFKPGGYPNCGRNCEGTKKGNEERNNQRELLKLSANTKGLTPAKKSRGCIETNKPISVEPTNLYETWFNEGYGHRRKSKLTIPNNLRNIEY